MVPVVLGDGSVAFLAATARRPPLPTVRLAAGGAVVTLAADRIPGDFPVAQLVVPRQVVYQAADGVRVHAQLFERAGGTARKPAAIFVHGGPPRQMLLGWHYSSYYSNAYALNQYLASRGFVCSRSTTASASATATTSTGRGRRRARSVRVSRREGGGRVAALAAAGRWVEDRIWGGSYGGY